MTGPASTEAVVTTRRVPVALLLVALTAAVAGTSITQPLDRWSFATVALHAATTVLGCLVLGRVLLGLLGGPAFDERSVRAWAALWAGALVARYAVTVASERRLTGDDVHGAGVVTGDTYPEALLVAAWAAAALAVVAAPAASRLVLGPLLGVAVLAPALAGHAVQDGPVAAGVVMVHIAAATVWVGMLVALAAYVGPPEQRDLTWLARLSQVSLGCFVALAASGAVRVVSDLEVLTDDGPLLLLVVAKVALLVVCGAIGHRHRRRTLPAVAQGRPGAFWSLLAGEVVLVVVAAGFGVALAHSAV